MSRTKQAAWLDMDAEVAKLLPGVPDRRVESLPARSNSLKEENPLCVSNAFG